MIMDLFNCTLQIKLHACWLDQHKRNRSTRLLNLKHLQRNEKDIIVVAGRGSVIRRMKRMKVYWSNNPSASFITSYMWFCLVRTSYFSDMLLWFSTSSRYRTCFAVFEMLMLVGTWWCMIISSNYVWSTVNICWLVTNIICYNQQTWC